LPLYDGKPYCPWHYARKLNDDLAAAFDSWDPASAPPERFLYLLGRLSDEQLWENLAKESYLSPARIRNRGFDFVKTDAGCEFKIVRHLNAHKLGYVTARVTETWAADIANKTLTLVGTRDFQKGDIDS